MASSMMRNSRPIPRDTTIEGHDQTGDDDEEKGVGAREVLSIGKPRQQRLQHSQHHYHKPEPGGAGECRPDIDVGKPIVPQFAEPMAGDAVHREGQSAVRTLERQQNDGDHRTEKQQDEQREQRGRPIEVAWAALSHAQSSLRMSTRRVRPQMTSSTVASRITACAAAGGNCSAPICVFIIFPTEAICWPPITPIVTKSPITIVSTKMEPMTIPGLLSGITTLASVCQPEAPQSVAASISVRSMRIIELKMGTIMNSVYRCTKARTTANSENSNHSSG